MFRLGETKRNENSREYKLQRGEEKNFEKGPGMDEFGWVQKDQNIYLYIYRELIFPFSSFLYHVSC